MSQERDNQAGRPLVAKLAGGAIHCGSFPLRWTNNNTVAGRSVPGGPGLSARDGNHGRKPGRYCPIGGRFGLGAHVDGETLSVGLTYKGEIFADL